MSTRIAAVAVSFVAFTLTVNAQMSVTGTINASQVTSGTFNISLIPTGTTSTTVALGNDSRFLNATSINGVATSTLTGIVKFSGGSPSNAAYGDVVGLWTGCAAGTPLLRYDGTCGSSGGTGTVTSVGLAAPATIFAVSGSPVTGSGTLTLDYATGQTANQVVGTNGAGAVGLMALTAAMLPSSITSNTSGTAANVTGTVALANGGTGQTTATAAFNALSPLTTAGDVLYGGTSGAGTRLAPSTATTVLHSGTTPSWGAVNLGTDVTGSLPAGSVSGLAASATTDTTNAANITTGTLPAGRLPTSTQVWNTYTVSYTNLSTASTTTAYTVVTLTAKQVVCGLIERLSTSFAGSGISGLVATVGDSTATATTYSPYSYNLLAAVSNANVLYNNLLGAGSWAGGNLQVNATSTGGNLSALTAGALSISVCTVTIP